VNFGRWQPNRWSLLTLFALAVLVCWPWLAVLAFFSGDKVDVLRPASEEVLNHRRRERARHHSSSIATLRIDAIGIQHLFRWLGIGPQKDRWPSALPHRDR
jgi:hypothetical protein